MKKILIVEDDTVLNKVWVDLLEKEGYKVDSVEDGKAGLTKAKKTRYDLIYTGLLMPQINGIDFIRTLKEKKIKHGKIVVFSNLEDSEIINEAKKLGADEYIKLKDITPQKGIQIMQNLLR
jgi:CheY-like chemotaxis protein